jgi:hypothetical protein
MSERRKNSLSIESMNNQPIPKNKTQFKRMPHNEKVHNYGIHPNGNEVAKLQV